MGIANELITRGWHQGAIEGPDGSVCLSGAVFAAVYGVPQLAFASQNLLRDDALTRVCQQASNVVASLIERAGGRPFAPWNDAPERTFDEVLRVAKETDELLGL